MLAVAQAATFDAVGEGARVMVANQVGNIVVGVDGSEGSIEALRFAVDEARITPVVRS